MTRKLHSSMAGNSKSVPMWILSRSLAWPRLPSFLAMNSSNTGSTCSRRNNSLHRQLCRTPLWRGQNRRWLTSAQFASPLHRTWKLKDQSSAKIDEWTRINSESQPAVMLPKSSSGPLGTTLSSRCSVFGHDVKMMVTIEGGSRSPKYHSCTDFSYRAQTQSFFPADAAFPLDENGQHQAPGA